MLLGCFDALLAEMCIEQVQQKLHASLAVHLHVKQDWKIAEYIITLFCDRGAAVSLLNSGWYLQDVLETNKKITFYSVQTYDGTDVFQSNFGSAFPYDVHFFVQAKKPQDCTGVHFPNSNWPLRSIGLQGLETAVRKGRLRIFCPTRLRRI